MSSVWNCIITLSRRAWKWRENLGREEKRTEHTRYFFLAGKPRRKRRKVTNLNLNFIIIHTQHGSTDRTFCPPFSPHSCSSSNNNSRSEPSDDTPGSFVNTFPRAANTSDPIRVKCREMLANALQTGGKRAAVFPKCRIWFHLPASLFIRLPSQTITSQLVQIATNSELRSKTISFPVNGNGFFWIYWTPFYCFDSPNQND